MNTRLHKLNKKMNKVGRPSQSKNMCSVRGIVKEIQQQNDFEEAIGNDSILMEAILQYPLHLKCISNTVRQIDKNGRLEFVFTDDYILIFYSDPQVQNKCYLKINCKSASSYYFNYPSQRFIKFEISISHLANTFNFYNRSSLKTEMRIFGVVKPSIRIDSYKSEKKTLQKITNTINIRLSPSVDDHNRIRDYLVNTNHKNIANDDDQITKMTSVFKNINQFNNCYFVDYKPLKIYQFTIQNQDIRKFITEVQKDCQKILITRDFTLEQHKDNISETFKKLKQISIKAVIPGSSSIKKIETPANQIKNYKCSVDTEEEYIYSISSNLLKQVSSTNPNCLVTFLMLSNQSVILKIKDGYSVFKFQITGSD